MTTDNGSPAVNQDLRRVVEEALTRWRQALINLTRRNRLLNFKPADTSAIRLVQPDAVRIVHDLAGNKPLQIQPAPPRHDAETDDTAEERDNPSRVLSQCVQVDAALEHARLGRAARNLRNRVNAQYLDTGLHVLYLGIGSLNWTDVDGEEHRSPLLLVPVVFDTAMPSDCHVIRLAEEDPAANPALALKMKEIGIDIPALPDVTLTDDTYTAHLKDVRAAIAGKSGWTVTDDVWLTYFSFTKEAMYRDLLDHGQLVADHPQVQALAASGTGLSDTFHLSQEVLDEIDLDRIDDTRPPEEHPTVLDADASQRRVIAAVKTGHSLVVSGPPGTGKSQTITNMIAALLHEGRTVLFVSEKAAALEVVYNRLQDVGLGEYVLELHSHRTTRAGVSKVLSEAIGRYPQAQGDMPAKDRQAVKKARETLNGYAAAINETREPLSQSVLAVMGEVSLLHHLPTPEPSRHLATHLTPELLAAIEQTGQAIARAWRPAQQRQTFLWWGVQETSTVRPRLEAALSALGRVREARQLNDDLVAAFEWTRVSDTPRLTDVTAHMASLPSSDIPDVWWTTIPAPQVHTVLERLEANQKTIMDAEDALRVAAGVDLSTITSIASLPAGVTEAIAVLYQVPAPQTLTEETAGRALSTTQHLHKTTAALEDVSGSICRLLQIPPATTIAEAHTLSHLLHFADRPTGIPDQWLSRAGLEAAKQASAALYAAQTDLADAASAAGTMFTPAVLELDLRALQSRFANVHTGMRKLGGAYREDRDLLAGRCQPNTKPKVAIENLVAAIDWQDKTQRSQQAEQFYGPALAGQYQGSNTDWPTIAESLKRAEFVINLLGGSTQDLRLTVNAINGVHSDQSTVNQHLHQLDSLLRDFAATGNDSPWPVQDDVSTVPFTDLREQLATCERLTDDTRASLRSLAAVTGRNWDANGGEHVFKLRDTLQALLDGFQNASDGYASTLQHRFGGLQTDVPALRADLRWLEGLRAVCDLPDDALFSSQQAAALRECSPQDLTATYEHWTTSAEAVKVAFAQTRREELNGDLDDFDDAEDLLVALLNEPDGQAEWFAYNGAMKNLTQFGLEPVVGFCVDNHVVAEDVPNVIRKAVLTGWVDTVIDGDERLQPFRLQDRQAIIDDYVSLDRKLISTAIAAVLERCNQRRPTVQGDQSAVILAEGSKKRRHMPIRDLIRKSQDVTLAIKPCFMMSPQSVSQYLPPDIGFDVVIFDEASQVKPEDAINSIYRGKELVIVGDENQMPPTSFYESLSTSDDDAVWVDGESNATDFESVLTLATGSAAFDTLPLLTHYRSRHEDLIAFSNHSFYGGGLHTFPSATNHTNALGVEFFYVPDGVYQRGTTRDNPREAEAVVDRIVHHHDTRPGASLGVVAFSQAQADAVERALEERAKARPDLQDVIQSQTDRLSGFFIKNLETVQGDERDVILFSIGYGPDQHGKVTNNFGPMNLPGGWRRLNVAITRARNRVEVVSSIHASQITGVTNDSIRHLRNYLDYAERGNVALALDQTGEYGDPESPFEESVIALLHKWGYLTESQVGTAGYRIDIAVRHPKNPDTFMLGIECDGYAYHSSKSARDRDRIRHEILTGLGWRLHHIWGTSWYRHRESAEAALREALTQAENNSPEQGVLASPSKPDSLETVLIDADLDQHPGWAVPYQPVAGLTVGWAKDPADPSSAPQLREHVQQIVAAESPMHTDLLNERIREAWNIGRVGHRIREAIDTAIKRAKTPERGGFLYNADTETQVRYPANNVNRTIHQIAPEELQLAILLYVTDSKGIGREHLITNLARLYGWSRNGANITTRIQDEIDALVRQGSLREQDTRLIPRSA